MKFRYKRFLFYVLRTISVVGLVGMTTVVVLSAIGKLPDFPLTDVQAWLLELLLIFSNHFDIRYNANRKKRGNSSATINRCWSRHFAI